MFFIIHCMDKPKVAEKRAAAMQAHKDYIATAPVKVLLSGPLTTDDGESVIGSFFMVEAKDRRDVERFQSNDPMYRAAIWDSVQVQAFAKRIDNR